MTDEELARLRIGLQIALVVWPAFGACDWLIARAETVSVEALWGYRAVAWLPILAGVVLLRTTRLTPGALLALDLSLFSTVAAALTLMGAVSHGLATPYSFGVAAVLVYRGVIIASPWQRGLVSIGVPALVHVLLLVGSNLLRGQATAANVDMFIFYMINLTGIVLFLIIGNHTAWRLRRRVNEQAEDVRAALEDLQRTQAQLVQSEKMASIGTLVAGVAHEINNPVTFIVNNVGPLEEHVQELQRIVPGGSPAVAELLDEVGTMVSIIGEGAQRTAAIVRDLRAFSRLDEQTVEPVDVHEIIEVTLRLLRPRWAGRIEVRRQFGAIGLIEAARGPLNQVVVNVLSNACDAIVDRGHIEVETSMLSDSVRIVIRDDGTGISQEHLSRVFDPFFTTKAPGRGTGLGLSITHGIVTEHGGTIRVEPVVGGGTAVAIELPVRRAHGVHP